MIQTALFSKWHVHAVEYALMAEENELLQIKLVWDEDEERGKKWAQELGVPFVKELAEVFSNSEIEAVIVNTPTIMHKDIILAAAKSKKHIFTEKVLALTVEECDEILKAVEENGVNLMVSLPRLTFPYYLYAQNTADQGLLGKITRIRCRVAHNGAVPSDANPNGWLPAHFYKKEQCGGGALIDLGAHPIYLTNRLGGEAKSVMAHFQYTYGHEVEDNASVLVEYQSGAVGLIETGFVSYGSPFMLEINGTEGTLLIEDDQIRLKSLHLSAEEWFIPDNLPARLPMPMEQWVRSINGEEMPSMSNEDFRNLTLINEAAALSAEIGRRVSIEEIEKQRLKSF
ncbi:Gfo/Idh/MocA family protein [Metabacillus sp. RGM 3146]|uniref:Gfo/Idh/MocA family protein n=1 Tax=Metabacillus sp. RGM 3146 TaxID=3401092 RepID=UPI003B9CFAC2